MPKISSSDIPSYAGHEGHVTNAVGEVYEVDPTKDVNGEDTDGLTVEPVGEPQETLVDTSGPITRKDNEVAKGDDGRTESQRTVTEDPGPEVHGGAKVKDAKDTKPENKGGDQESAGNSSKESSSTPARNSASKPANNR